jgi:hypothetical protein
LFRCWRDGRLDFNRSFTGIRYLRIMTILPVAQRPDGAMLEIYAERAGLALGCVFSSSEEFEADIIRARRAAGDYGPKRQSWRIAAGLAAGVLLVIALLSV